MEEKGSLPCSFSAKKLQRCQVEGCNLDLSHAKPYYSRHRVCGLHSKTPKVVVSGIDQRFCQQCSRFHQLPEFDQGKRSCRRRLAGHNERRRKPPQGSKNLPPSAFDNNHIGKKSRGGFVMDFTSFLPNPFERGLTTNQTDITGKYEVPWQHRNSPHYPLSDLVSFNGVSDSTYALSLLSNPSSSIAHFPANLDSGLGQASQPGDDESHFELFSV